MTKLTDDQRAWLAVLCVALAGYCLGRAVDIGTGSDVQKRAAQQRALTAAHRDAIVSAQREQLGQAHERLAEAGRQLAIQNVRLLAVQAQG